MNGQTFYYVGVVLVSDVSVDRGVFLYYIKGVIITLMSRASQCECTTTIQHCSLYGPILQLWKLCLLCKEVRIVSYGLKCQVISLNSIEIESIYTSKREVTHQWLSLLDNSASSLNKQIRLQGLVLGLVFRVGWGGAFPVVLYTGLAFMSTT